MQIAIDGPAAAGKTTTAKALAKELGFLYVDTGALYRVIALDFQRRNMSMTDIPKLLQTISFEMKSEPDGQHMYLYGEDVSNAIRTPEISKLASDLSAISSVRDFLLDTQRSIAASNNVVMEGRDIGSVILPDADVKFYLTADLPTRAVRRQKDEALKGNNVHIVTMEHQLQERDYNDMTRKVAPLVQVPDALFIDNTFITAEQTKLRMLEEIKKHM